MWRIHSNPSPPTATAFNTRHQSFPSRDKTECTPPAPQLSTNICLTGNNFKYLCCVALGAIMPSTVFDTPGPINFSIFESLFEKVGIIFLLKFLEAVIGKYYIDVTKANCFVHGTEGEANRSHTASQEFEFHFWIQTRIINWDNNKGSTRIFLWQ